MCCLLCVEMRKLPAKGLTYSVILSCSDSITVLQDRGVSALMSRSSRDEGWLGSTDAGCLAANRSSELQAVGRKVPPHKLPEIYNLHTG